MGPDLACWWSLLDHDLELKDSHLTSSIPDCRTQTWAVVWGALKNTRTGDPHPEILVSTEVRPEHWFFYRLPRTEDLGAVWCLRFRGEVQKSLGTHQSLVYAICSISYKLAPSQLLKSLVHLWTCSPPLLLLTVHRKAGQQQMITTNRITNLGLFANHC